jgi:hypothetical protein
MLPGSFLHCDDHDIDIHHRGNDWVALQLPSEAETVSTVERAELQPRHVFTTLRNALLIPSYLYDFHL